MMQSYVQKAAVLGVVTVQAMGALDTDFHRFTQIEAIKQALLGT